MSTLYAVVVTASDRPGMMSAVTKVLADHNANIRYVDLHSAGEHADIYFEVTLEGPPDALFADLKRLNGVHCHEEIPSFAKIYGKRIATTSVASASPSTQFLSSVSRSLPQRSAPPRAFHASSCSCSPAR